MVTGTWSLKYRSHAIGFFDFIQVSSFAAYFSRRSNGCKAAAATPNDLSPATSIHPLVTEMPLEDLKLSKDLKLCCECWPCTMLCSFSQQTGTSTKMGRHTEASAIKILLATRFEVSAKLKLSQLSTRRHSLCCGVARAG